MKTKKIHLDLNHYSNDSDGIEAFMDDFFFLSMPRLLETVYQAKSFCGYYIQMEDHTRQLMDLYYRLKSFNCIWKDIMKSETFLAEVPYKRFFLDELMEGIKNSDSKAIIK